MQKAQQNDANNNCVIILDLNKNRKILLIEKPVIFVLGHPRSLVYNGLS